MVSNFEAGIKSWISTTTLELNQEALLSPYIYLNTEMEIILEKVSPS